MTDIATAGAFPLGDRTVNRMGYGAMQLAGPGVFGPPKDPAAALAVLREAVASGVNHIDTSDFYGPHVTNQTIREALHPYPAGLTIVTKVGAVRGADASWNPAMAPDELARAVNDNLRNLGLDALDVVNLRVGGIQGPSDGSIEPQFSHLADLQRQGLIRCLGLSNVTSAQVKQARGIALRSASRITTNLAYRADDAFIDELAGLGIAYVPFFPLGGFTPLQSSILTDVAAELGATPMQTALAWLLQRAPNILLIPGTSSLTHLRENLKAAEIRLPADAIARLNAIGGKEEAGRAPSTPFGCPPPPEGEGRTLAQALSPRWLGEGRRSREGGDDGRAGPGHRWIPPRKWPRTAARPVRRKHRGASTRAPHEDA